MNIRTWRAKMLLTAGVLAASTVVLPIGSAYASGGSTYVTSVAVAGTVASPTVTVKGHGFGAAPTKGVALSSVTNCPSGLTGTDFPKGELWIDDASAAWSGGFYSGAGVGNCVGVNVVSWSATKVVFTFGNQYNTFTFRFADGDGVAVSVKGAPGNTVISGLS